MHEQIGIYALRMSHTNEARIVQHTMKAWPKLVLCFRIEVDYDIAAKYEIKLLLHWPSAIQIQATECNAAADVFRNFELYVVMDLRF